MKKLLALVLALVMTLSLTTMSANAADFEDGAAIDFEEAVDVLNAMGVLVGSDGKFNPDAELTRAQAAKIIAYLDLGETVAEAMAPVQVFDDVPATHWAAKYIAYCADAGIINGVGNGKFSPNGKLTGYAFGKMLLVVLGYDATYENLTGSGWEIRVARLMNSRDITKGVSKAGSAVLTREEAAQYAFNTIKSRFVETYATQNAFINGQWSTQANAALSADTEYFYDKTVNADWAFKDLAKSTSAEYDSFGRPAHIWTYDGEEVGTYADSAKKTYTVTSLDRSDSADKLELNDVVTGDDYLNLEFASGVTAPVSSKLNNTDITYADYAMKLGDVVEVFTNDANKVTNVVVLRATSGQITKITDNTGKATYTNSDGEKIVYKYNITVDLDMDGDNDKTYNEYELKGYTAEYVKDAYLSVYLEGDTGTKVLGSKIAKTATGSVSAYNSTGANPTITVAGTSYKMVDTTVDANIGSVSYKDSDSYAVVLNDAGFVIGIDVLEANASISDVVFTDGVYWNEKSTKYGVTTYTYYVQTVKLDGTVADVLVGGYTATPKVSAPTEYTIDKKFGIAENAVQTGTTDAVTSLTAIASGMNVISSKAASSSAGTPAYTALTQTASEFPTDYHEVSLASGVRDFSADDKKITGTDYYLTSATTFVLVDNDVKASTKTALYTGAINYDSPNTDVVDILYKSSSKGNEVAAIVISNSSLTLSSADYLFVKSVSSANNGENTVAQDVYDMTGKKTTVTADAAHGNDLFVSFTVASDGKYSFTEQSVALSSVVTAGSSVAWDTGDNTKAYKEVKYAPSFFDGYFSLKDAAVGANVYTTLSDVKATDMVVVDLRSDYSAKNGYDATISSLADIDTAYSSLMSGNAYYYDVEGAVLVEKSTGAKIFFVLKTVQGRANT